MAIRLESTATLRESGWSLTMLRDPTEMEGFTEEILDVWRADAERVMPRAQDHIVGAIKRMLSKVYPVIAQAGSMFSSASGTERRRKNIKRQPAPSGAPPGHITEGPEGLRDSWKTKKPTWSKNKTVYTGRYFSRHPAAGALEFGSPKQGIASHPYQRIALQREGPRLDEILSGTE
jgi:hypothetical protein